MANRLTVNPDAQGTASVNTTEPADKPARRSKDRSKDRHSPGYMREYMRLYRLAKRGAGAR
jgi:hypothetical protein